MRLFVRETSLYSGIDTIWEMLEHSVDDRIVKEFNETDWFRDIS